MPYSVKILLDSIGENGKRITTWELTYPRFVHAELMTHRLFSRNSSSSRAIPVKKMMDKIVNDTAMPVYWGANQAGMQAASELEGESLEKVKELWLKARDNMVEVANGLMALGLHKQLANRITEPWMFITVILTATEYDNWFKLRAHKDAQPEIRWVAEAMKTEYEKSVPQVLKYGEWHVPMLLEDEKKFAVEEQLKIATARCARVSYLTHDGKKDYTEDAKLHDRLAESGHWSPFEHCAQSVRDQDYKLSNFQGWNQYRKNFYNEDGKV